MGKARQNKRARQAATTAASTDSPAKSPVSRSSLFQGQALWIVIALIVVNIAAYWPVWQHDFVSFDDPQYVTENPEVLRGLTAHGVQWALTSGDASNWHPLTWLSHMLDVQMFGVNAGPQHVINLVFHIANSILLFGLFYSMTGALGRSAFVASLFAVHPLHVESVAWISERKDVLSTFFAMLTIWAYVAFVRRRSPARYGLVMLLFGLGLMAKPMLVTLPFVLVLLDVWPLERTALQMSALVKSLLEKIPLIALALTSSIVTFMVQLRGGAVSGLNATSPSLRLANALNSYIAYIAKAFWPMGLAALYPFPKSIPAWQTAGSILILVLISIAVFRYGRQRPYIFTGWLWYLGTLVPVIGLVQVGTQSMADRYMYVPLIGLSVIAAWGIPEMTARIQMNSAPLLITALLVVAACIWGTHHQVAYWHDSDTLWNRALEVTAENSRAHVALGSLLQERGNLREAMNHYSEALKEKPDFAEAHNKLGATLADQGRVAEAIPHYMEAIRLKPDFHEALNNLGNAAASQGKLDEAIKYFSDALRVKPDDANVHNGLGSALDDKGKIDDAIAQYQEALRLDPNMAAAHNNMAAALLKGHRVSEAIQHAMEAIRIQPNNPDFRFNAGMLLQQQARTAEAREQLEAALKINPGYQAARSALLSLPGPAVQ